MQNRIGNNPFSRLSAWRDTLALAALAFVLRLANLGKFATHDEVEFWFSRSESLLNALQSGNYALMDISTHPGVTTMWLGSGGILLHRLLFEHGLLQHETFSLMLALYRLPIATLHAILLLAGYAMLRRLLPPTTAALAALFWAVDPFIIGYSRLLHVDALVASFGTLSLLAACLYWCHARGRRWLIISAVCAGLAILSKSPALALGPLVLAVALASGIAPPLSPNDSLASTLSRRLILQGGAFVVWGIICAITIFACFPALWVAPLHVIEALRVGVEVEGAQPHMTGNFFLGHRDPAPGWLFYHVALAQRATPWTLAGILLLPLALHRLSPTMQSRTAEQRRLLLRDMAILAAFLILFTVAMSIFPKKFNRYLVPVFPAFDILAAVGLMGGIAWLTQGIHRAIIPTLQTHKLQAIPATLMSGIVMVAIVNAGYWHPYEITAFNQLFGGAKGGAETFVVGWGEGLEQAAAWLNQQEDITDVLTISHMITSFDPFLRKGARATFPDHGKLKPGAGYVVVSIAQVQGGAPSPPFDQFYGKRHPLHTVTLHGVEYVWVYAAPPPTAHVVDTRMGEHVTLYGYTQVEPAVRGQPLRVRLVWQTNQQLPQDYWLFAHLVGEDGKRYNQVDQPYPTSAWTAGRFHQTETQIPLPPDLPAGTYRVVIGLYDPQDGGRLAVPASVAADPALAGPDALVLLQMVVE